ncbi:short chain dehydrogenase [Rhodobacteraceae bacterium HTCC2150]|nr:short chain dehydrogenase [Rhodobacteraceae bacterium HTCC2150]
MKILLIGAAGDIGRAAYQKLSQRHDVVTVGRTGGDFQVDISNIQEVRELYGRVGHVDAVVSCAGDATFAPLSDLTQDSFMLGLSQKVMGQINLVIAGLDILPSGGSFTLTSGVLDRDPIKLGVNAATANGALAGFVKSAAIEMPRGIRVNVVSPGLLEISEPKYGQWFHGHKPVSSIDVGRAYAKSVEGALTGQVIIVA